MVKKKRQSDPGENGDESTESCEEMVKSTCPHITKAVDLSRLRKELRGGGFAKECAECKKANSLSSADPDFEDDLSLWMCLRCGSQLCGRARNQHALNHFNTPHSDCHALTANTSTWNVYCYSCNNEVTATSSKKLHECVEYVKKLSSDHTLKPSVGGSLNKPNPPIELILNPPDDSIIKTETIVKGKDKINLQRVRGLSNLGNTCFFNSVMQCLVQTPYLLDVLQEMANPGEKFTLPGGKMKLRGGEDDGKEIDLPPITGQLGEWGPLTKTLAETLAELKSGEGGVYTPRKLLVALVSKLPQFGGGDQHDSHELLRHLLEAVRSEDLRRYQAVILSSLGMSSKVDPSKVDGEVKQKVKFYGQQASDTMLRPEQVFRGFLVSTLECQACFHQSDRAEYFLDLSLPVAACRPQPPALVRRKPPNDEPTFSTQEEKPSKHQIKKERTASRKWARRNKGSSKDESSTAEANGAATDDGKSSSESDADVEDNLDETVRSVPVPPPLPNTTTIFKALYEKQDTGHNLSGQAGEKTDDAPEFTDKDRADTAAIPLEYKPLSSLISIENLSNPDSGVASPEATKHNSTETVDNVDSPINGKDLGSHSSLSSEVNLDLAISQNKLSLSSTSAFDKNGGTQDAYAGASYSNEVVALGISVKGSKNILEHSGESSYESLPEMTKANDVANDTNHLDIVKKLNSLGLENDDRAENSKRVVRGPSVVDKLDGLKLQNEDAAAGGAESKRVVRTSSPRYVCEEDECSVQSCLSQFTSLELLTGNNKVGCETCTERAHGKDGKTVYTNATKRFLVSSPPAILILHLKRFQLGPRCMFRKMSKHVDFPTILDLAPFCAMDKVRKLPNVSKGQNELLYSLYGIVEHSGGMHGGHYVAYVKVRGPVARDDPRWWFLPRSANVPAAGAGGVPRPAEPEEDSDLSGYESGEGSVPTVSPPPGKWYYVSDSMVSEISEEKALRAQAYLLFYERIV